MVSEPDFLAKCFENIKGELLPEYIVFIGSRWLLLIGKSKDVILNC